MPVSVLDGPLGPTLFKVISGSPSAEELAAVTLLLTALASTVEDDDGTGSEQGPRAAEWDRPERVAPLSWRAARRSAGS
ncbi:acyl-CoA carboxylase subunit epsilon [Streptomyces sp. NPDC012403]|jgi:hypothetical protein|uniref:acyl-CoA carboxylase subunit epsilon n=1 Tax=unclassified Streptomyces TaxID=2593676 RepID=UPI0021FCBEF7|nr:acyl-CoA carboxylase [Streptomyces atrovirens]